MQLPGWRPLVWLGCAAVLALAPELTLVLLRVPELGARPLLGLLRPVLSRPAWLRSAGGTNVEVEGSLTLSPNTWHHVVGTASGTEWKLYVDGVEDTTLTVLAGSNAGYFLDYPGASTETNEYNIGILPRANGETDDFEGNIGAFRIYNRVLTATEVSQNYNATRGKYGV